MGWSYGWDSRKSLADHLTRLRSKRIEVSGGSNLIEQECIGKCFKGNHLWAAFEDRENGRPVGRFVVLFLMQGKGGDWGYKDVDEGMGPAYYSCPVKYLDMTESLSPKTETSRRWRECVREAARIRGQKIVKGMVLTLTNGKKYTVCSNDRGRILAWDNETLNLYRIPRKMLTKEIQNPS